VQNCGTIFIHLRRARIRLRFIGGDVLGGANLILKEAEWSDFKILLALSRGGSVAGAARLLGLDSSTVSRRLAVVEEAIGACLVLRGGREFSFTAEGKAAIVAAEKIEQAVTQATSSIRATKTEIAGTVRISCVPSLLRVLLQLPELAAEKHPRLRLEINAAYRVVDLGKGEADIAIRMVRPTEIDVVAKRVVDMGWAIYASKSYLAKHGRPNSPDALRGHHLVPYIEDMLHMPWFSWIEQFRNHSAPTARVDSTEMALSVIMAGGGIGCLPCVTGDSAHDLVRIFPEPVAHNTAWIVYHESLRDSARIRFVADLLIACTEERRILLSGSSTQQ
jgi:DNA-binding transcriptional LysR family regulator